jgi:hypothetical protein
VVNIQRGKVGQGAAVAVLELDPPGPARSGRQVAVATL